MSLKRPCDPDERTEMLAAILAEAIDRRRCGENPTAAEYTVKHPHLQQAIEDDFAMLLLLEGQTPVRAPDTEARAEQCLAKELGPAIAELPESMQRVIVLRSLKGLRWAEVAEELGEPEDSLRREYAQVLRRLLERVKEFTRSTSRDAYTPRAHE